MTMSTFSMAYENTTTAIEFDPTWNNGTGYLDGAVYAPVPAKEMRKFVTENGRRGILVGTEVGTVVVFERYSPSSDGVHATTIVANAPLALSNLTKGRLTSDQVYLLVGGRLNNIGTLVSGIRAAFVQTLESELA